MKNNESLDILIQRYGEPDALIDNFSSKKYGYAIWGYDEIFEYNISDIKSGDNPFNQLQNKINFWKDKNKKINCIGFISYDIKNILYPHIKFKKIESSFPKSKAPEPLFPLESTTVV